MADIRINSLPSTATSFNTDDYIAIDGASAGTRRMLAANPPFSDVTLGTSGPSVKSSLSARAPRQGLVFDGSSNGATVSVPAIGTGNFTAAAWLNVASFSNPASIFGQTNGVIDLPDASTMRVYDGATGTQYNITIPAVTTGKVNLVTWTRSGTTLTAYVNGVSAGTTTCPLSLTAFNYIGSINTANKLNGTIEGAYLYNRALSASEVVALYEAGAPAGADYIPGGASTALYTSNFTSGVDGWNVDSPNTRTAVDQNADGSGIPPSDDWLRVQRTVSTGVLGCYRAKPSVVSGTKIRLTTSIFLPSGSPITHVSIGSTNGSVAAGTLAVVSLTAGATTSVDVSFTLTGSFVNIITSNSAGAEVSVVANTAFYLKTMVWSGLGLLLAPDAAQAGGGLVWYDTSGNAANITLPASGVSWNVPTSGVLGGNWSATGTFGIGSTSSVAGFSSTEAAFIVGATRTDGSGVYPVTQTISDSRAYNSSNPPAGGGIGFGYKFNSGGSTAIGPSIQGFKENTTDGNYAGGLRFLARANGASPAEAARITSGGNYLLGTTTDSANGKLQLATHTTSAGGIGFGTDVSLYRSGTSSLSVACNGTFVFAATDNGAADPQIQAAGGKVTRPGYSFTGDNNTGLFSSLADTLYFSTGGTTALTLDSSQNILTSTNGIIYTNRVYNLTGGATPLTIGWTGSAGVISVFSSGETTFAGAITSSRPYQDISSGLSNIYVYSTDTAAQDKGGTIQLGGAYTGTTTTTFGGVRGSKESTTAGETGGQLEFFTRANGGAMTRRAYISSTGDATFAGTGSFVNQLNVNRSAGGDALQVDASALAVASTVRQRLGRIGTSGDSISMEFTYQGADSATNTFGLAFYGKTAKFRLTNSGNVVLNNTSVATNASNGFVYVASCAGTPTGTPATYTGTVPIVVDSTNNKLYFYSGGAWRDAGP